MKILKKVNETKFDHPRTCYILNQIYLSVIDFCLISW